MSISTAQRTPTEAGAGRARLADWARCAPGALVHARLEGARTVIHRIRSDVPVGLRQLTQPGSFARVGLLQTGATLVAGDRLRVGVIVGPGAQLELVEISATLAHPVRAGSEPAVLDLQIELDDDSRLMLAGQPLIVAAGSKVRRSLSATLWGSAQFVQRETFVLGRHGESPGALFAHTRIERDGFPILDEVLDTSALSTYGSPAVLGDARVIDALGGFGLPAAVPPDAFLLGSADTLVRRAGQAVSDELDAVQAVWRQTMFGAM